MFAFIRKSDLEIKNTPGTTYFTSQEEIIMRESCMSNYSIPNHIFYYIDSR